MVIIAEASQLYIQTYHLALGIGMYILLGLRQHDYPVKVRDSGQDKINGCPR